MRGDGGHQALGWGAPAQPRSAGSRACRSLWAAQNPWRGGQPLRPRQAGNRVSATFRRSFRVRARESGNAATHYGKPRRPVGNKPRPVELGLLSLRSVTSALAGVLRGSEMLFPGKGRGTDGLFLLSVGGLACRHGWGVAGFLPLPIKIPAVRLSVLSPAQLQLTRRRVLRCGASRDGTAGMAPP